MILELDTELYKQLKEFKPSNNQIIFITLVLNENQNNHQDVMLLLSQVDDTEIQDLINKDLIAKKTNKKSIAYEATQKLLDIIIEKKDRFAQFYDLYPVYVTRPDGTKGFLRANKQKCKKEYNHIVGKSNTMHEHLLECLSHETSQKLMQGKLGYMKTMWKWLVNREWEIYEEQIKSESQPNIQAYGTELM